MLFLPQTFPVIYKYAGGTPAPDQHPVRCGTDLRLCRQPSENHSEAGRGSRERTSMAVLLRARRQASPEDGPKPF